jgi:two-component system chemotaxis response regulator CheY
MAAHFEASNGKSALEILSSEWVDLILTDVNMPEMDGEEFLQRLASDDLWRGIPVVVVSTDATAPRMRQMLSLGARGYVTKPFTPEILRLELDRAMEATHA